MLSTDIQAICGVDQFFETIFNKIGAEKVNGEEVGQAT